MSRAEGAKNQALNPLVALPPSSERMGKEATRVRERMCTAAPDLLLRNRILEGRGVESVRWRQAATSGGLGPERSPTQLVTQTGDGVGCRIPAPAPCSLPCSCLALAPHPPPRCVMWSAEWSRRRSGCGCSICANESECGVPSRPSPLAPLGGQTQTHKTRQARAGRSPSWPWPSLPGQCGECSSR
jgi:hypothetical protein